jgi:ubiquinone/menaquinone biosynthesis C-methylase UbiE
LVMAEADVKDRVREFYDRVGWQEVGEGLYQNARYEDLRPVSREYIHRCHMRVLRHLRPQGRYLLDAGSGPIQYPEYLEYSSGYQGRVCVDISSVALQEARKRIGECGAGGHGLFVAADIAYLPFKTEVFDGVVSLHTVHHLPRQEHARAYRELYRVLAPASTAVVVNGWDEPPLSVVLEWVNRAVESFYALVKGRQGQDASKSGRHEPGDAAPSAGSAGSNARPQGTYVRKSSASSLKQEIGPQMQLEIRVWRSISVRTLRTLVHEKRAGRGLLRLLFWLEERFPHFFGENGQYPMVIIRKPGNG